MSAGEDETGVDVVVDEPGALTVRLNGVRFDGGRVPITALTTLQNLDAVVRAISKDIEVALRPEAKRASRYATVELALVGEIEEGSSILKLLFAPLVLAGSGASADTQAELLATLPAAVPAVVEAVYTGSDTPYPLSERTVELVGQVGQRLGAEEEMVISPFSSDALNGAVDERAVTVTLEKSNTLRLELEVSERRSFFVTGTLRQLENHGDEPGSLSLATSAGLFRIPSVDTGIMSRAAAFLSRNPKGVVAISGTGDFDGKGRLKRLTHLTDIQSIDRIFNPEPRLAELAELSESVATRLANARPALERAVLATGRAPGLFIDEDEDLEARWIIRRSETEPARVVSATFGAEIHVYVYDRASGEVTHDVSLALDDVTPGDQIANVIQLAEADSSGG